MGKTHTEKEKLRQQNLQQLPRGEKNAKFALIKRKEGRTLNAEEKHALKMKGKHGQILYLWEQLRSMAKNGAENNEEAEGPRSRDKPVANASAKESLVKQILQVIEPDFASACKTPKMSRVVQCCIKHGSNAQVEMVFRWITKDHFAAFCTDSFSHFIVLALLRRRMTHDLFHKLLAAVFSSSTIVRHKIGLRVINACYTHKMCSVNDKHLLILSVFKDSVAIMKGWKGYPVLEDILAGQEKDGGGLDVRKKLILALFPIVDKLASGSSSASQQKKKKKAAAATGETASAADIKQLSILAGGNAAGKGNSDILGFAFVQRLISCFLHYGGKYELDELAVSLKSQLPKVMETKEGVSLATRAIEVMHPKTRKEALGYLFSSLHPVDILCGKYSAAFVSRLCDLFYDAQMLHKYVIRHLLENIQEVVGSPYGHLIILHLLTPEKQRKSRLLFPHWLQDFRLFAVEEKGQQEKGVSWNQIECLNATNDRQEVVEIVPSSVDPIHTYLQVLPEILKLLMPTLLTAMAPKKKREEEAEGGAKIQQHAQRQHCARIAKELLYLYSFKKSQPSQKKDGSSTKQKKNQEEDHANNVVERYLTMFQSCITSVQWEELSQYLKDAINRKTQREEGEEDETEIVQEEEDRQQPMRKIKRLEEVGGARRMKLHQHQQQKEQHSTSPVPLAENVVGLSSSPAAVVATSSVGKKRKRMEEEEAPRPPTTTQKKNKKKEENSISRLPSSSSHLTRGSGEKKSAAAASLKKSSTKKNTQEEPEEEEQQPNQREGDPSFTPSRRLSFNNNNTRHSTTGKQKMHQ